MQVSGLLDANTVSNALSGLGDVTHIFHCAYLTCGSDQHKDAVDNLALCKNVVEAIESAQGSGGQGSFALHRAIAMLMGGVRGKRLPVAEERMHVSSSSAHPAHLAVNVLHCS
jgi:hypothetical protein